MLGLGREILSLSSRDCVLHEIGIDLCVLVGLVFWNFNFFHFFVGGFATSEEEEEEQCMFEMALFWSLNVIFNLVLKVSKL